jgi:branched-chain amino acid transport system ATP-binding protein
MNNRTGSSNGGEAPTLLKVHDLEVSYGGVRAVSRASLEVGRGDVRIILGANGAGKSSIIRTVVGLVRPQAGTIEFPPGQVISGLPPHAITERGIAWVPEGRRIFANLTVRENLMVGAFRERNRAVVADRLAEVFARFPRLKERSTQLGGSLSGGEQQMLAIGRALMSGPQLLVLDEPSLGLAPQMVHAVFAFIAEISKTGMSILMAEQNANQALEVANYAYLMENGEVHSEGASADMAERDDVKAAYLGG